MKSLLLALCLPVLALSMLMVPATAAAWDPFGGVDCNKVNLSDSAVCTGDKKGTVIAGGDGLLVKITDIIATVAGIAAVIVILYGGIKYVISAGDPKEVNIAKDAIIYALVGLAVIVLARTLIVFVITRI